MKTTLLFLLFFYSFNTRSETIVSLPQTVTTYLGVELYHKLLPTNTTINFMLCDLINLSVFDFVTSPPEGRSSGLIYGDLLNQQGIQILINRNEIEKSSLIISNTGHDIPIAAQLLKNKKLTSQAVFHLPREMHDPGNFERIISQAQDWAEEINSSQLTTSNNSLDILFIGVEAHRRLYNYDFLYEIDYKLLPSKNELLALNINRVIYLHERHPNTPPEIVKQAVPKDIKAYLDIIDLPISYYGVDCRRDGGCDWKPKCRNDHTCGWKDEYGYQ